MSNWFKKRKRDKTFSSRIKLRNWILMRWIWSRLNQQNLKNKKMKMKTNQILWKKPIFPKIYFNHQFCLMWCKIQFSANSCSDLLKLKMVSKSSKPKSSAPFSTCQIATMWERILNNSSRNATTEFKQTFWTKKKTNMKKTQIWSRFLKLTLRKVKIKSKFLKTKIIKMTWLM